MIDIKAGDMVFAPKVINFPDGTFKINIETPEDIGNKITVRWLYNDETELVKLIYIAGNLGERYSCPIELFMPYLPNARMDRVHEDSEVFTLKYFCRVINSLGFDKVKVLDVHSSVGAALIDRIEVISPEKYIRKALELEGFDSSRDMIFFPDEGSCKRYQDMFKDFVNFSFGIKKRDWATGKILGLELNGCDPEDKRVFIVDDICAYGGTVYYSAQELKKRGCKEITVFFSHCEDSIEKGKLFGCGMINRIYTTNSTCTLSQNEILKIFDITGGE